MEVEPPPLFRLYPALHLFAFVSAMVIHDQMPHKEDISIRQKSGHFYFALTG
jgi:hypothetical protein